MLAYGQDDAYQNSAVDRAGLNEESESFPCTCARAAAVPTSGGIFYFYFSFNLLLFRLIYKCEGVIRQHEAIDGEPMFYHALTMSLCASGLDNILSLISRSPLASSLSPSCCSRIPPFRLTRFPLYSRSSSPLKIILQVGVREIPPEEVQTIQYPS